MTTAEKILQKKTVYLTAKDAVVGEKAYHIIENAAVLGCADIEKKMQMITMRFTGKVHYWYAEKERKARDWDLKYMKEFVPETVFKSFKGMDHGDMTLFYPERMAQELLKM